MVKGNKPDEFRKAISPKLKQTFPHDCFPNPVNGVVCPVSKRPIRDSVPDAMPPVCPGAGLSKTLNDPNKSLPVLHNGHVLPLFPHYC